MNKYFCVRALTILRATSGAGGKDTAVPLLVLGSDASRRGATSHSVEGLIASDEDVSDVKETGS